MIACQASRQLGKLTQALSLLSPISSTKHSQYLSLMCLLAPSAYVAHLSSTSLVNPQRNFHLLSIQDLLQSTAEAGQPAATSSHCHVNWRPRLPGQRVRQNIIPSKPMKPTTISAILPSLLSQVSQLCWKWSHMKHTHTQTHTYI